MSTCEEGRERVLKCRGGRKGDVSRQRGQGRGCQPVGRTENGMSAYEECKEEGVKL